MTSPYFYWIFKIVYIMIKSQVKSKKRQKRWKSAGEVFPWTSIFKKAKLNRFVSANLFGIQALGE